MRKYLWLFCVVVSLFGCRKDDETDRPNVPTQIDLRAEMRQLIIAISRDAEAKKPGFIIMPQNGVELVSLTGAPDGNVDAEYLNAVDAINKETLPYSGNSTDQNSNLGLMKIAHDFGLPVFGIEYCRDEATIDAYDQFMADLGYIGYGVMDNQSLNDVPSYPTTLIGENDDVITEISQVQNAVYVLTTNNEKGNSARIDSKLKLKEAVTKSNYDLLVTDLSFDGEVNFTSDEIELLRPKRDGGSRLILCYLSIGQAEGYRSYWLDKWNFKRPDWIPKQDGYWDRNYYVWYWTAIWHGLMYGDADSQLNQIIAAGFDGVFLDKVDAFNDFDQ